MKKIVMCMFVVLVGMLMVTPSAQAVINLNEIVEVLKHEVDYLNFRLYNIEFECKGGGPGCSPDYYFPVDVVDGVFDAEFTGIEPGTYRVEVDALDSKYMVLFNDKDTEVTVVAQEVSVLEIVLELADTYHFRFVVSDLPGELDEYGSGVIIVGEESYHVHWEPANDGSGRTVFHGYLPHDFESGRMEITDSSGRVILAQLDFNIFDDLVGLIEEPYQPPENLGNIDANITFAQYSDDWYIRVGDLVEGIEYGSIQAAINDAIEQGLTYVEIYIGDGDYDGFDGPADMYIAVYGLGPDKTRIRDFNPDQSYVIRVSSELSEIVETADVSKGGGPALVLRDLCVHNGEGKQNEFYGDAAIVVEFGAFVMNNCSVVSSSNNCVATYYDSYMYVNHCSFFTPVGNCWGTYMNSNELQVLNSIFLTFGHYGIWTNNCDFTVESSCFSGFSHSTSCDPVFPGFLYEDPEFANLVACLEDPTEIPDFRLLPTSSCIGAALDGLDIGVVFDDGTYELRLLPHPNSSILLDSELEAGGLVSYLAGTEVTATGVFDAHWVFQKWVLIDEEMNRVEYYDYPLAITMDQDYALELWATPYVGAP